MNIIYVLINESMPGLCKIGRTNQPIQQRLRTLSSQTAVPLPFECFYAKKVINAQEIEEWLKELFKENRINPRREFFSAPPAKVVLALKPIKGEEIVFEQNVIADDQQEIEALKKIAKRRENFNFKKMQIPIGSTLTFVYDETITCTVLVNNRVEFRDQELSMSEAARIAYEKPYPVSGSLYWIYQDKTLDEYRKEYEEE